MGSDWPAKRAGLFCGEERTACMAKLQIGKSMETNRTGTAEKQDSVLQKPVILGLLAIFCCALWGSAFPGIKIGYQLLSIPSGDQGSQIVFAGYRFFLAGLLVLFIGSLAERRPLVPSAKAVTKIVKLSMLQTVLQYTFFYLGVANTSGVKGSIIVGANSLFVILIAGLLFKQERLTGNKILGCAAGLAGVAAANLGQGGMEFSFRLSGEGFVLCSSLSYAFSTVFMKRYSREEDPIMLSGWQFLLGGLLLTAFGLLLGGKQGSFHAASAGILIYLAFVSAAAYSVWGLLLKYNPASRVAIYGFMNPVIGVLLSALLLHEGGQAFSLKNLAALILVCAGVVIVNGKKEEM